MLYGYLAMESPQEFSPLLGAPMAEPCAASVKALKGVILLPLGALCSPCANGRNLRLDGGVEEMLNGYIGGW